MRIFKNIISLIITVAFVNCFIVSMTSSAYTLARGVMFREYYRIKNAQTGQYVTLSGGNVNGAGFVMADASTSSAQIFYLDFDFTNDAYLLKPQDAVDSNRTLTIEGTTAVLRASTGATNQAWNIAETAYGYLLSLDSNTTQKLSYHSNGTVGVGGASGVAHNWVLEPAVSGTAYYFMVANDLTENNSAEVNSICGTLNLCGYTTYRVDCPPSGQIRVASPMARVTILHGHGNVGYLLLQKTDGSPAEYIYSENPENNEFSIDQIGLYRNKLVIFISCYSAAADSKRSSLVQAAYNSGAGCVLGFNNEVAGGEYYVDDLMYALYFNDYDVETAVYYANSCYSAVEKQNVSCPAHPDNLVVLGNDDLKINMY